MNFRPFDTSLAVSALFASLVLPFAIAACGGSNNASPKMQSSSADGGAASAKATATLGGADASDTTTGAVGPEDPSPPSAGDYSNCAHREIYCVTADGVVFKNEQLPDLQPGAPLTVQVWASPGTLASKVLRLEARGVNAAPQVFAIGDGGVGSSAAGRTNPTSDAAAPASGASDAGGDAGAASDSGAPTTSSTTVESAVTSPPDARLVLVAELAITSVPDIPTITILYTRYGTAGAIAPVETSREYQFSMGRSGYHFEAGILFPIVFGGTRTVNQVALPNTGEKTLEVSQSIQAVPVAIALHYFPWGVWGGRDSSTWTAWGPDKGSEKRCINPLQCVYWWFIKPLGLEAGTTIGANSFQEYFLGVAYGPVRGGTLSAGMTFVKGDFIPKTYREGMLTPSNGTQFAADRLYMIRPYIGLTLSPEVLGYVVNILEAAKKISPTNPQDSSQQ